VSSKNRVREVQWQQRTEDLAILWHEVHPTLQLGMQASTRKNKQKERETQRERERERERLAGGKRRDPGFRQVGTRSPRCHRNVRALFLTLRGFQGCFLIACGVGAG
jgi:hypothetical protein